MSKQAVLHGIFEKHSSIAKKDMLSNMDAWYPMLTKETYEESAMLKNMLRCIMLHDYEKLINLAVIMACREEK